MVASAEEGNAPPPRRMAERDPSKPTIAVDMDEVLVKFVEGVRLWYNEKHKTSYEFSDFTCYDFQQVWGGTKEEAMIEVEEFFKTESFRNLQVVEGAKEAMEKLREMFNLVVVTSRQLFIEKESRDWLDRHFEGMFCEVVFGNHWTRPCHPQHAIKHSKKDLCRKLGAIALVDDAPKYVTETCGVLEKVILFDLFNSYGWSKCYKLPAPNTIRCASWDEVVAELSPLSDRIPVDCK